MRLRRPLVAIGTMAVLGSAGAYAVAQTAFNAGPSVDLRGPAVRATSSTARAVPTVADLALRVSALRRPLDAPMPARLRTALMQGRLADRFGPNVDAARPLSDTTASSSVWLVPGRASLCLVVMRGNDDGGLTCQTSDSRATDLSLIRVAGDGSSREVLGIAPDGVDTVEARHADGTVERVAVAHNLYEIRDAADVTDVTF